MREIYKEGCLYVVEFPPQQRTIKIDLRQKKKGQQVTQTFYLGFPYMQFYWNGSSLHLSFTKKPVKDITKNRVSFPFLPNIWLGSIKICLGFHEFFTGDPEGDIKKAIRVFWEQHFYFNDCWYGPWILPGLFERNS